MKKLFSRNFCAMLAVVTLVTAALVTNCTPLGGDIQRQGEDGFIPFDPPAGMGYIRIKVANNNAKTILPSLPAVTSLAYRILVEDENDGMNVIYDSDDSDKGDGDPIPYADLATYPILIVPGDYTVTVTAFSNTVTTPAVYDQQVGYDQVTGVTVGTGAKQVDIVLKPSMSGTGTFTYNITLPLNINATTTALLAVTEYPGGGTTAINNVDLRTTPSNTIGVGLDAGFYYVKITMVDGGSPAALQDRTITNILHIYDNITTNYAPVLAALNSLQYMVTYNANGGNALSPATPFGPFQYGSTLVLPTDAPSTPTHPTAGTIFDGWVRNASQASTTKWIFGGSGTQLIGPVTLYASWIQKQVITLDLAWSSLGEPVLSPASTTLHQADYYDGTELEATLACTITGFTVQNWTYKGVTIGSLEASAATASSITVTSKSASQDLTDTPPVWYIADILKPGGHEFAIEVKDTRAIVDSIPNPNLNKIYNVTFTINVEY